VTLTDGSITGTGAALAATTGSPNELETYTAVIRELNVGVSLWPLLQKRLEVGTIEIAGPHLDVRWKKGAAAAANYNIRISDLNLGLEWPVAGSGPQSAPPGERIPGDLSFSFSATADTLVLQKAPYVRLDLEGGFSGRVLEVASLSARRSTGRIEGNLSVDFNANPWGHLVFAAEIRDVPAEALLEPFIPAVARRLECELDSDLTGDFDLRDQETVTRTLNVKGRIDGGPGILHAADWLREATPYLGDRQDLKNIKFRGLSHRLEFSRGRYQIQELALTGGDTEWVGSGWIDLESNIALGIGVKLPPGFTPDLGNFSFLAEGLRDSAGRINLPLKLTGKADRPTVGVDFAGLRQK
jgi:hypothetical protein